MSNYGTDCCNVTPVDPVKELALWEILDITEKQISELTDIVNAIENKLSPSPMCEEGRNPVPGLIEQGLIEQAKRINKDLQPILFKLYRIAERL